MSVKPAGKVKPQKVDKAVRTEIEWLVDRHDGAPNFEMRRFTIKPGGSIPKHYHPDIEHEQYVLKGKYKVGIGDKVHEVKAGDSVYIPPGTLHWYKNTSKGNAEFLCIIPKVEKYDSVYVESEAQTKKRPSILRHLSTKRDKPRIFLTQPIVVVLRGSYF